MASAPASKPPGPRMSFAQVAAAANTPKSAQLKSVEPTRTPDVVDDFKVLQSQSSTDPFANGLDDVVQVCNAKTNEEDVKNDPKMNCSQDIPEVNSLTGLLKATNLEDGHVHQASSDSMKKDNSDTKSVTSRVTFTMEEKESLRPDDSASMQAGVDEDTFSMQGSIIATSRVPSDPDARAFDDQLREINQTGLGQLPQHPPLLFQPPPQNGNIYTSPQEAAFPKPPVESEPKLRGLPDGAVIPPDEKLLEALRSPRDRVFVLKIEQDIIDFVKDRNEQQLHLPQTNSFYRMLTHKLADYYLLQHVVDESMTSVRLFRTGSCRLPPPLIDINSADINTNTPPPNAPMRKIMRRGLLFNDEKGTGEGDGTVNSSQNPSKTTSEAGTGSGDDDRLKDKAALTREERENRYKEARARIFKDFKEDDTGASDGNADPNGVSRASSVSASKKATRNNKLNDDGFEARSAYTQYPQQPIAGSHYFPQTLEHPNMNQYPTLGVPGLYSGLSSGYSPSHHQVPGVNHPLNPIPGSANSYAWQYSQYGSQMPRNQTNFGLDQSSQAGFASMSGFQSSGQAYPSPNSPSQTTPKMISAPPATYGPNYHNFSPPADHSPWPQAGFAAPYTSPGFGYIDLHNTAPGSNQSPFQFQPMPLNGFMQQPRNDYNYQQQMSNYHRQFNPLSQSFIPGTQGSPQRPHPSAFNHFNGHQGRFAPPGPQPIMNGSQTAAYLPSLGSSGATVSQNFVVQPVARTPVQAARNGKPFQSSISKWGTPSTLPPKPPPPASSHQQPLQPPPAKDGVPPNPMQSMGLQPADGSPKAPAAGS